MNRKLAVSLVVALAAAGPVLADDITIDPHPFVSTLTRAQVQQELREFRQAGVNPWADDYNPVPAFRSARTRAQVTAEFLAERDAVAALNSEDSGSSYLIRVAWSKAHPARTEFARAQAEPAGEE